MARRQCEQCSGVLPNRMHRQRNDKGQLVCDSCAATTTPDWPVLSTLTEHMQAEYQRRAAEALASIHRTARLQRTAHDSGDEALIHHCFGGMVRYWTKEGLKSFAETVGTKQWVLTSEGGNRTGGYWVEAEIKDFGVQELWRVVVERNGITLDFEATSDHIWLVKTKPMMAPEEHPSTIDIEVITSDLVPGFYLSEVYEEGKDHPDGVNDSQHGWKVVEVGPTGRSDRVYCAQVPDTHTFALEGNIWTHNCPFCGSGAVTGGSDGSVDCEYCQSVFTVQVQPKHPNAPQTIDGHPAPAAGMPAGQEMELSTPVEQAIEEVDPDDPTQDPSGAIAPEETQTDVPPQFRQSAKVAEQGELLGRMPDGREIRANVYRDKNGDRIDVYDKVRTPDGRLAEVGATIPARLAPDGRTIQVEYEGSPGYDTYGDPGTDDRDYEKFRPTDLVLVEQHVNNRQAARTAGTFDLDEYEPQIGEHVFQGSSPVARIVSVNGRYGDGWVVTTSPDLEEIPGDGVVVHLSGIQSNEKIWRTTSSRTAGLTPDRRFFTEDGDVLDLNRYVDHLALKVADDRLATLASIRQARQED